MKKIWLYTCWPLALGGLTGNGINFGDEGIGIDEGDDRGTDGGGGGGKRSNAITSLSWK